MELTKEETIECLIIIALSVYVLYLEDMPDWGVLVKDTLNNSGRHFPQMLRSCAGRVLSVLREKENQNETTVHE